MQVTKIFHIVDRIAPTPSCLSRNSSQSASFSRKQTLLIVTKGYKLQRWWVTFSKFCSPFRHTRTSSPRSYRRRCNNQRRCNNRVWALWHWTPKDIWNLLQMSTKRHIISRESRTCEIRCFKTLESRYKEIWILPHLYSIPMECQSSMMAKTFVLTEELCLLHWASCELLLIFSELFSSPPVRYNLIFIIASNQVSASLRSLQYALNEQLAGTKFSHPWFVRLLPDGQDKRLKTMDCGQTQLL